jgi:hypothetical protein
MNKSEWHVSLSKTLIFITASKSYQPVGTRTEKNVQKELSSAKKTHFLVKGLVSVVPNYVPKANNVSNL